MLPVASTTLRLAYEECKATCGDYIEVFWQDHETANAPIEVLKNPLLMKFTSFDHELPRLTIDSILVDVAFYDTLLLVSPICWFAYKAASYLQTIAVSDLPQLLLNLVCCRRQTNLKELVPAIFNVNISEYTGEFTEGETLKVCNVSIPRELICSGESCSASAFSEICKEYPVFLANCSVLVDLLLVPELYPCVEDVAEMFASLPVEEIDVKELRRFHSLSLAYEIGNIAYAGKAFHLPINHAFFSVTRATSDDIAYMLRQLVGNWILELDMTHTVLTGSMVCCVVSSLVHGCAMFEFYPSYSAEVDNNIDGSFAYAKGFIYKDGRYPVIAGADVDLAVDVPDYVQLERVAEEHFAVVKRYYPMSEMIKKTAENSSTVKFLITTQDVTDYIRGFRNVEIYRAKRESCFMHHIGPVRAYWDGNMIYASSSCVDTHVYQCIRDYRYYPGKTTPRDVLEKYSKRGFHNETGFLSVFPDPRPSLQYDVLGMMEGKVDERVKEIVAKMIRP